MVPRAWLRSLLPLLLLHVVIGAPKADLIDSIPGWDKPLPSRQYSGYLDVGKTKHIHYVLVESERVSGTEHHHCQ